MLALRYDSRSVRRVAAKIGYALFCTVMKRRVGRHRRRANAAPHPGDRDIFERTRIDYTYRYPSTTSEDPHYIVLSPRHDRSAAFVSLYGFDFRVELGTAAVLAEPIIIVCKIDGSGNEDCFRSRASWAQGPNGNCGIFSAMARGRPARRKLTAGSQSAM